MPSSPPIWAAAGNRRHRYHRETHPSCAGTHPTLDALLDLRRCERFVASDVESIEVGVDAIVPTILIYDRPATGLEAKFSMPFCAAAAIVDGRVGIDTFDAAKLADPLIAAMQSRVTMQVDPALDSSAPALTQARVTVRLKDGRVLTASANGARGYPERPASSDELAAKFVVCASRVLPEAKARLALKMISELESAGGCTRRDGFFCPLKSQLTVSEDLRLETLRVES